jgi:hypothetical protein
MRRISKLLVPALLMLAGVAQAQQPVPSAPPELGAVPPEWPAPPPPEMVYGYGDCALDGSWGGPCKTWWCGAWYLRVETVVLDRNNTAMGQTIVETAAGDPVITTRDFDLDLSVGISAYLGRRIDSLSAWEFGYTGAQQWEDAILAAGTANLQLPDPLGGATDDFLDADEIGVYFASEFHSAEVSYLRDWRGLSWLAGFRYINWEEELAIGALDADGDISTYNVGASNNLVGAQIGVRALRKSARLEWEFTGKAGLYGNEVRQLQRITDDDGTVNLRVAGARENATSFVGDLNVSAYFHLNRVWRLRGGYNLIWIADVALAPDQLDFGIAPGAGTGLDFDGDVFLHGFNVGIEALW